MKKLEIIDTAFYIGWYIAALAIAFSVVMGLIVSNIPALSGSTSWIHMLVGASSYFIISALSYEYVTNHVNEED